ncbi:MAG: bifunctional metallophosphatase/5'-nucleotidase [Bacteroidales bacterium]|nr:bifunctional metallophosphatase/5'-nucleotidase [Bacteroidales bacterium]
MKKLTLALLLFVLPLAAWAGKHGQLHIVTTGDVHGTYFSKPYVDGAKARPSLVNVKYYVDSLRAAVGPDNVLLLDCGDVLQGDNCSYYFNYVETELPHIVPRIFKYMGYDAAAVGNHDIETGHPVYDRVKEQMAAAGIPWLAGNAFKQDGSTYFPEYVVLRKGGRKILIMGYNNSNIDHWLAEEIWRGMNHRSLVPLVQERVDALRKLVKPDAVIVLVHSGTGKGDGSVYENQGLDIFNSLHGVDLLVCGHDHQPACIVRDDRLLIDGGARCGNVGHAVLGFRCHKVTSRTAELVRIDKTKRDVQMEAAFEPDWLAVRNFTLQKVGEITVPLRTREAYSGMCSYIDLLHTVQLAASGADLSVAAPLTFNGSVAAGTVVFDDMFKIYPFENQLYVLTLSGAEFKNMLEYSYDKWIVTPGEHVLNIRCGADARSGASRWSFVNRSYNFDSAAGLSYTVDVTKPFGSRVEIVSMADGSAFEESATYKVAMTSYRANGGGSLLTEGAGIPHEELAGRVVAKFPEIRDIIYEFIRKNGTVGPSLISDRAALGWWKFVPEAVAEPLLKADMDLMF